MDETVFDIVIVGSGFGGSVMACRLAEAGLRVCLLERGKEYPPGSFPRSPYSMKNNVWNPREGSYGLFNIWSFRDINAVISSGLGGGSLIYANALLRKDEKWFVQEPRDKEGYEYWPVTRAELDPYYERVEQMLGAQYYPFEQDPYNKTAKTLALKQAATQLDRQWGLLKLAVTFGNKGEVPVPGDPIRETQPNMYNRTRHTCRLCGECDIGCNYGSKNSLDYTYLSEAQRKHADIRKLCEVRSFEPIAKGYAIHYVQYDLNNEGQKLDTHDPRILPVKTITASRLILAAGTFGTTYLLLKNRSAFPLLSKKLGTRFSSNGDLVNFALKCSESREGKRVPRLIDGGYGPVITSAIRFADEVDGGEGRGFYIEDSGYPEFVNWMLQLFDVPAAIGSAFHVLKQLGGRWLQKDNESDISGYISPLFGQCDLSSGLLPLVGMGRDTPGGQMQLRNGKLELTWRKRQSDPLFRKMREQMKVISDVLGAQLLDDPLWKINRAITVHPLGGCPMGRDDSEGVVNAQGEVFHYPGLYIADGSIMPGPVGANPSLTIAALAERIAEGIIECTKEKNA